MVRWHPLEDVGGTASTLAAGDRRCRPPRPLHARRGTAHPSQLAYIDAYPLSLSTDQVPANAAGYPIIRGAPSRARIQPNGQCRCPRKGDPCRSDAAGSMARNWCAILGHAFPIDGSTIPPSSSKRPPTTGSGKCRSQPQHAHWEAVERLLHYSPDTPDPRFAHAEASSPQKGHPNATAASPWTGAPHWGARPPPSRAGTSQRRNGGNEAYRPRSPESYTFQQLNHLISDDHSSHRDHARAAQPPPSVTTWATQRPTRSPAPSLSAKGEAFCRIAWTAREVRGSVAEMAVGPGQL